MKKSFFRIPIILPKYANLSKLTLPITVIKQWNSDLMEIQNYGDFSRAAKGYANDAFLACKRLGTGSKQIFQRAKRQYK